MNAILAPYLDAIEALCREYGVATLEVFGSVCTDAFDAETSDIDFIVHYRDDVDLGPWLQQHFDLKAELTKLLGRPVDLIMATTFRNPYIRRSVDATRRVLYAA